MAIDNNDTYMDHARAEERYRKLRNKETKKAFSFMRVRPERHTESLSNSTFEPEYFRFKAFNNKYVLFYPEWHNGGYCGSGYLTIDGKNKKGWSYDKVWLYKKDVRDVNIDDLIDNKENQLEFKSWLEELAEINNLKLKKNLFKEI